MTKAPPKASERTACWEARDAYFACLDSAVGGRLWLQGLRPSSYSEIIAVDPLRPQVAPDTRQNAPLFVCRSSKKDFDSKCLASWVLQFHRDL